MSLPVETLGPLRHHCYACGKCCFGIQIPLTDPEECARITRYGELLALDNAVENNEIRVQDGRCPFLDEDLLCRIHKEYGFENKPHRCREFPLKATQTESNVLRAAVDPGCVNTYRSWQDGEEQQVGDLIIHSSHWEQPDQQIEALLTRASEQPGASIGSMLHVIAGLAPTSDPALPPGFAGRLIERAQAARLRQFIHHPELGWGMRSCLEHLPDCVDGLDPSSPPPWPVLNEHQEAFALEVFRRVLFLRLAPMTPASQGLSLLILSGAVLAAWADPSEKAFGEALSVWSRIVRIRALWFRFFPDPAMMRWMGTGQGPPGSL
jgi:Fe-S-cluster containining protein